MANSTKRVLEEDGEASPAPKRGRGKPPKNAQPEGDTSSPSAQGAEQQKRSRGRPRKRPLPDPNTPKRPRGRPRKDATQQTPKKDEDEQEDSLDAEEEQSESPEKPATATPKTDKLTRASPKSKVQKVPKKSVPEPKAATVEPEEEDSPQEAPKPAKLGRPPKKRPTGALADIIGTYTIRCDEVENNWPDSAEDMELSIIELSHTSNALVGSFNMGIIEGTMVLAADEATLSDTCKVMSKNDNPPKERASKTGPSLKDRFVYFSWRGRNTGDTEIHPGTSGSQWGTLKFLNDQYNKFKGTGAFPALGSECVFFGNKVSGQIGAKVEPWSHFSAEAAEEANKARWG